MPKNPTRKPLEIKISTVVAVAALIGDTDQAALSAALTQLTGGSPDYFDDDFTVLDFAPASPSPAPGSIDWVALIALFKSHRLNPVAVRNIPVKLIQSDARPPGYVAKIAGSAFSHDSFSHKMRPTGHDLSKPCRWDQPHDWFTRRVKFQFRQLRSSAAVSFRQVLLVHR